MDVRYFDYGNTAGFSRGFNPTPTSNVVEGLGWQSIYSIAVGAQRRINCRLTVRLGYCWNQNPIPRRNAALAVSSPMITQHVFSCGFTFAIGRGLEMSFAYSHAFRARLSGPFDTPHGPGTGSVTNSISANSFFTSIAKKW
jgi:long-chain fatty acid transport protein